MTLCITMTYPVNAIDIYILSQAFLKLWRSANEQNKRIQGGLQGKRGTG